MKIVQNIFGSNKSSVVTINNGVIINNGRVVGGSISNDNDYHDYTYDDEHILDVNGATEIDIKAVSTNVDIYYGERFSVKLQGISKSEKRHELIVKQENRKVIVTVKEYSGIHNFLRLTITIPKQTYWYENLYVETVSGDILISPTIDRELFRHMFINSTSGNVTFEEYMVCDDITVESISGNIDVHSIVLHDINVRLSTVSGNISLSLENTWYDMRTRSTSGDISMRNKNGGYLCKGSATSVSGNIIFS